MAGHASPTGHDTVITSQTWPLNVPAHHRQDPLGASITRTVEPALVGPAATATADWHPLCVPLPAVIR